MIDFDFNSILDIKTRLLEPRYSIVRRALGDFIYKWAKIWEGSGVDLGTINCPLCDLFKPSKCVGCPIAFKTQEPNCSNTPYEDWLDHQLRSHSARQIGQAHNLPFIAECGLCKVHARKEIKFLKDLYKELYGKKKKKQEA